jgi:aryl-alcohol dehydrogenase-like predicted oxidoreductase
MNYRSLGKSGLKVSAIGLGTNQFGGKVDAGLTKNIIHTALDLGITFIDTADVYQAGRSEEFIGRALAGRRQEALIATKVYYEVGEGPNDRGASRQHIMNGVEASLKRLKTDYIDLYQIHSWDEDTPLEETMRALDDLVHAGKVRYIGASNFSAWQLVWAIAIAKEMGLIEFVSIQPHYHMLERTIEQELIPACISFGIGILPYFPLAGGFLTGKYSQDKPAPAGSRGESSEYVQRYMTPRNYSKLAELSAFADEHDRSMNELAHAWLLAQPQISSIISGATSVDQVQANAAAADWELADEEVAAVNAILDS